MTRVTLGRPAPVQSIGVDPDRALRRVLAAIWQQHPAVIVPAPPGSGKSFLIELVASMMGRPAEPVAIACQTVAQTRDLAHRIADAYWPGIPQVTWLAASGTAPSSHPGVRVVTAAKDVGTDTSVVVATAAKWATVKPDLLDIRLLVVDEAWQLTDANFARIAPLCQRYLLVGDPGQIAPVVTGDVREWRHLPYGPHRAAPEVLRWRFTGTPDRPLPDCLRWIPLDKTRRFGADSVSVLQPVFYPDLPFSSAAPEARLEVDMMGLPRYRNLYLRAAAGTQIIGGWLPPATPGLVDREMAADAAALAEDLLQCSSVVRDGQTIPLRPEDVAIVCARRAQVTAILAHLNTPGIRVDTAERLQGQQAEVVIMYHPTSGLPEVSDFVRNAGRTCVMASRHRTACFVLVREGTREILEAQGMASERILSDEPDDNYKGWKANLDFLDALATDSRRAAIG